MMDRSAKLLLFLSALSMALGPGAPPARAWGGKGHQLQARAALGALPADVPAFLRQAVEEMAYLIVEPDRWRTSEQPALTETAGTSHGIKWEIVPHPLPANRHLYLIELAKQGKLDPPHRVADYGTVPYAFQEWAEMLTAAFRRWRAMPESSDAERAVKRQHERSILFMAGVAGHWATDVTNPMHASVHGSGWHSSMPNPNGYEGKGLHARFESQFVDRAISFDDVAALVDDQPRLLGDWLREVEKVAAASNTHLEQIYIWDKKTPFGSGEEPPEAAAFTAARLAEGARFLRDLWYTAWVRSGEPLPK
jgi:hypothetical protein